MTDDKPKKSDPPRPEAPATPPTPPPPPLPPKKDDYYADYSDRDLPGNRGPQQKRSASRKNHEGDT